MTRLRLSGRQKALLAATLALLLWLPTGVSHEDQTAIVTGHSTFYNGEGYDPCLASIAGIMRSRVMWFNDQVLVERYGGKGTYIYATEYGAPDPRGFVYLYSEGVYYDFVDPNGAHWHVEEAWYSETIDGSVEEEHSVPNPGAVKLGNPTAALNVSVSVEPVKEENKYYVWFVELSASPIYDDYAGADPHTYYNFLNLVDTCKFNKDRIRGFYAQENHTGAILNSRYGHPNNDTAHSHEKFIINLWTGRKPVTVPLGDVSSEPSSWESSWATQYAEQESAEASQSVPDGFGSALP